MLKDASAVIVVKKIFFFAIALCLTNNTFCMKMDIESVPFLDTKAKITILEKNKNKFEDFTKNTLDVPLDLLKIVVEDKLACVRQNLKKESDRQFAQVKKAFAMDEVFWLRVEKIAESFYKSQKDNFCVEISGIPDNSMDLTTFHLCCDTLREHTIDFTRFDFHDFKGKNQLYIQFPSIPYSFDNNQVRMHNDRIIRGAIAIDSEVDNFSAIRQDLVSFLVERLQECSIDDCRLSIIPSLQGSIRDTFELSLTIWNQYKKFSFQQALAFVALKNHQKAKMICNLAFRATPYLKCDEAQLTLFSKIARYWKIYDWIKEQLQSKAVFLVPRVERETMFTELNTAAQTRYVNALLAIKKQYGINDLLWQSIIKCISDLRRYNALLRSYELPDENKYSAREDLKVRIALFLLKRKINPLRFTIGILEGDNYRVESPVVVGGYVSSDGGQTFVLDIVANYCLPGIILVPKVVCNAMLEHIVCMIELDLDQADYLLVDLEKHFNTSDNILLMSAAWKQMMIAKRFMSIVLAATRNEEAAIFLKNIVEKDSQFLSDDRELLSHIVLMWRLKSSA